MERTYYPFTLSLSDCKCCAANRSQLVDFVVAQCTLIHHTHTHTKGTEGSRPHVLPTLCQCRESVDADCGIKGEFHPQDPFFPLRDTINLRCSVHSSTYFVIKCCNLLIRCPRSLSTSTPPSPLLCLMLPCISQNDAQKSPSHQKWTCCSLPVRWSVKKKWVTHYGSSPAWAHEQSAEKTSLLSPPSHSGRLIPCQCDSLIMTIYTDEKNDTQILWLMFLWAGGRKKEIGAVPSHEAALENISGRW